MKRIVTFLGAVAVTLCAATAQAAESYGWTVSASSSDPFVNTTTATGGLTSYYLWLACCDLPNGVPDGMSAAEFDLEVTGANLVATIVQNGFLNAGGTTNLLLAVGGCPCGPVMAAELLVVSNPGTICLVPSLASSILGTVDCQGAPELRAVDWTGLSIDGATPCGEGAACNTPISVEESSWGSIKGLYQ